MDSKSFSLTKCTSCLRFLSRRNAAAINLCARTLLSFFLYSGVSSSSILIPVSIVNKSWCVSIFSRSLRDTFLSSSFGVKSNLLFFWVSMNLVSLSVCALFLGISVHLAIFILLQLFPVSKCLFNPGQKPFYYVFACMSWLAIFFVYPGSISCVSWRLMFHLR